jgi:Protein of unknown function with HXXEE motif
VTLFWFPLAAASAHVFEEFVWPGGFTAWYRGYVPEITKSASPRFLFWINVALLFGCLSVAIAEKTPVGPAFFIAMCTLLAVNGVFHLRATVRTHRYSPGVLTGTLLYIPLAIYGYWALITTHRVSIATALLAATLGASYHFLSLANHRRRARNIAAA